MNVYLIIIMVTVLPYSFAYLCSLLVFMYSIKNINFHVIEFLFYITWVCCPVWYGKHAYKFNIPVYFM